MNKIFGKPAPPSSSAATAEDAEYYVNDEDEDGSLESLDSLNSRMSLESLESLPPFSPLTSGTGTGTGTGTPNGKSPLAMEMGRRMRSWRKSVASTRSSSGSVSNSGRSDAKKASILCSSGGTPDADSTSTPQTETGKSRSSSFRIPKRFSTSPKRLFKGNNKNANSTLAASEDKGQNHDPPTPYDGEVPQTPMLQPPTSISKNQSDQVLSPLTPLFTTTATTTTTTPATTIDNIISEANHDGNIKDSSDHSTPRADNVTIASFKQEPIEPTTTTTTAVDTSMNTKSTTDSELQSALESLGQSVKHIKELQGQLLQVVDTSVETDDSAAGYNEFLNISKADDSHEGPSSVKYTSAADISTDDSTGYNEFLNISRVDSSEGYDEFLNIISEGGAGMGGASDGETAADDNGSNHPEKKADETSLTYYETMVKEQENSTTEKSSDAEEEALDDNERTEILSDVTDEKEGKPIHKEEEGDRSEDVVDYESTTEDCQCFWPFSLFRGGTNHKQAIIAPPLPTSSTADTALTSIDNHS